MTHGRRWMIPMASLALLTLAACTTAPQARDAGGLDAAQVSRNAGYALLYALLGDEARVDGILIIKTLPEPTQAIIRQIASRSKDGKQMLEDFARQDPTLGLDREDLPTIEVQARKQIARKLTGELLLAQGLKLEVLLLVTQFQSTDYGQALARALQDVDPDPTRHQALGQLATDYEAFNKAVLERLQALGHRDGPKP